MLISNANDALGLLADDRKLFRLWDRIRSKRFGFGQVFVSQSWPWLTGLTLLARSKRDHEVDGRDLLSNDGLRTKVFREIAKNLL
jgi:hypothetical protein